MPETRTFKLAGIVKNEQTQLRRTMNGDLIHTLTEAFKDKEPVEAIILFTDGRQTWIGDGWHRFYAAEKAGAREILAEVRQGSLRDAILFAAGCNAAHDKNGQRRTREDKIKAVDTLLKDAEWNTFSNHAIAQRCAVSVSFVGDRRKALESVAGYTSQEGSKSAGTKRKRTDGQEYAVNPPKTDREPESDDDELPTDKVGKNSEEATKNGAEVLDVRKDFDAKFAKNLAQFNDVVVRGHPDEKSTSEFYAYSRLSKELYDLVLRWDKKIKARQKQKAK